MRLSKSGKLIHLRYGFDDDNDDNDDNDIRLRLEVKKHAHNHQKSRESSKNGSIDSYQVSEIATGKSYETKFEGSIALKNEGR